jgi:carboxyl-terminal processing protease
VIPAPEKGRKVSLTAALSTVIVAVVLAVLLTFSVTTAYMKGNTAVPSTPSQEQSELFDQMEIIDRLFRSATVLDLDEEALMAGILKGYVAATGDVYAEYFTADEYQSQLDTNNGKMCGIGVSVVNGVLNVNGVECQVITIANVYPESPAEAAGVLPGEHIVYVGIGEDRRMVNEIGYTQALDLMKGEEGTQCAFTVLRRPAGSSEGTPYEEVEITATRQVFTTRSVTFRTYTPDKTVGIIRLTGFDNTTCPQFMEAVETLKSEGCTSFVLDLRGNPGGLLTAVEDVLILFLQEDDPIITIKDASGKETTTTVSCNKAGKLMCGSGALTREDIGKYRDLKISLLVNDYSASAAELFTSNIRDYELGTIVGTQTYGKGCGQTTFSLSKYGYDGALKLTTFYYSSPLGDYYDGVGITPHVVVELSEEARKYNINLLPDELDNQLATAIESMK